jgi:hypothetical protein
MPCASIATVFAVKVIRTVTKATIWLARNRVIRKFYSLSPKASSARATDYAEASENIARSLEDPRREII